MEKANDCELQKKVIQKIIAPFYFNQFAELFPESELLEERVNLLKMFVTSHLKIQNDFIAFSNSVHPSTVERSLEERIQAIGTIHARNWVIYHEWSERLEISDLKIDPQTGRPTRQVGEIFSSTMQLEVLPSEIASLRHQLIPLALAFDYLKLLQSSPKFSTQPTRISEWIDERFKLAITQSKAFVKLTQQATKLQGAKQAIDLIFLRQLAFVSAALVDNEIYQFLRLLEKGNAPEGLRTWLLMHNFGLSVHELLIHWCQVTKTEIPECLISTSWGSPPSDWSDANQLTWMIIDLTESGQALDVLNSRKKIEELFPAINAAGLREQSVSIAGEEAA